MNRKRLIVAALIGTLFVWPRPAVSSTGEILPKLAGIQQWTQDASSLKLAGLLSEGIGSYERLNDYRALFKKKELSGGALGEEEQIFFKFEKPFKLFMKWQNTGKKGLQVLYERGRHDGKLAIHQPGLLLGLAPVVFLDRSSPWVRQGSESYDIEDAGIGTFLYDMAEMVVKGASEGSLAVTFSSGQGGETADVRFPGTTEDAEGYFAYRVVTTFDEATRLPVKMTLYDWRENVTGIYAYEDLSVDVGAEDEPFRREAQRQLFKLYHPEKRSTKRVNFASK